MGFKYGELLPNYLNGDNIGFHGSNIDVQNSIIDTNLELLNYWNTLKQPILIRKAQTEVCKATITIFITLLNDSLSSIDITGDYSYTATYNEDDAITSLEYSFECSDNNYYDPVYQYICNPHFMVTITTHEGYTYKKGYPENDTLKNNDYDHNSFLDMIGNLLDIPRRRYYRYDYTEENVALTTPPYFGKKITNKVDSNGYTVADKVTSCTEDDYYYMQRLQFFCKNFSNYHYPELMLYIIYDIPLSSEDDDDGTHYWNSSKFLCLMDDTTIDNGEYDGSQSTMDEYYMQRDDYNTETYQYIITRNIPINIYFNLSDVRKLLQTYVPCTRRILLNIRSNQLVSIFSLYAVEYKPVEVELLFIDEFDETINSKIVNYSFDNETSMSQSRTDNLGILSLKHNAMTRTTSEDTKHKINIESPSNSFYYNLETSIPFSVQPVYTTHFSNTWTKPIIEGYTDFDFNLLSEDDNELDYTPVYVTVMLYDNNNVLLNSVTGNIRSSSKYSMGSELNQLFNKLMNNNYFRAKYWIKLVYGGLEDNYLPKTEQFPVTVYGNKSTLSTVNANIPLYCGLTLTYDLSLLDYVNNGIDGVVTATLTYNGYDTHTKTSKLTVENGSCTFKYIFNDVDKHEFNGDYTLKFVYNGDAKHMRATPVIEEFHLDSLPTYLTVTPVYSKTVTNRKDGVIYLGEDVTVQSILSKYVTEDSIGQVTDRNVTLYFNNNSEVSTYTIPANHDHTFHAPLSTDTVSESSSDGIPIDLDVGNYTLEYVFEESDEYKYYANSERKSITLTVKKIPVNISFEYTDEITGYEGVTWVRQGNPYKVMVTDVYGNPLSNVDLTVSWSDDSEIITTNSKGVATSEIHTTITDNNTLSIRYTGSKDYSSAKYTEKLNVQKMPVTVNATLDKLGNTDLIVDKYYPVYLSMTDLRGNPVAGEELRVIWADDFTITHLLSDGTRTANFCSHVIGNNYYYVVYTGSEEYLEYTTDKVDLNIVESSKIVTDTSISASDVTYPNWVNVSGVVTRGLKGSNITVTCGDLSNTVTVSTTGIWKTTFEGLDAGTYTITAVYSGNDEFESFERTHTITVNKAVTSSTITAIVDGYNINVSGVVDGIIDGSNVSIDCSSYVNTVTVNDSKWSTSFTVDMTGDYFVGFGYTGDKNHESYYTDTTVSVTGESQEAIPTKIIMPTTLEYTINDNYDVEVDTTNNQDVTEGYVSLHLVKLNSDGTSDTETEIELQSDTELDINDNFEVKVKTKQNTPVTEGDVNLKLEKIE